MSHPRHFVAHLAGVVAGVFLLTMTAGFLIIPYAMSAHPGEASTRPMNEGHHPT